MHDSSPHLRTVIVECLVLLIATTILSGIAAVLLFRPHGLDVQSQMTMFAVVMPLLIGLAYGSYFAVRYGVLNSDSQGWKRQALTDKLTGVANRQGFVQAYDRIVLRQRSGAIEAPGLMLLIIDADHFKRVNDRLGHPAGDRALRAIAATLKRSLRPRDVVGRLGGEEFAALITCDHSEYGERVAEHLRKAVASIGISEGGVTLPLSVSIGGAYSETPLPFDTFYEQADSNCYRSKRAGRNRVTITLATATTARKYSYLDADSGPTLTRGV